MSPTIRSLGIGHLSPIERIMLAQELWDSIASDVARFPLGGEMEREIDRRLSEHRADPTTAIPWERVEAEALARLGR